MPCECKYNRLRLPAKTLRPLPVCSRRLPFLHDLPKGPSLDIGERIALFDTTQIFDQVCQRFDVVRFSLSNSPDDFPMPFLKGSQRSCSESVDVDMNFRRSKMPGGERQNGGHKEECGNDSDGANDLDNCADCILAGTQKRGLRTAASKGSVPGGLSLISGS